MIWHFGLWEGEIGGAACVGLCGGQVDARVYVGLHEWE